MFPAALSRASNGYIRRILIVGLAVLMLVATLAIAPGGAIADDTDAPVTNSGFVALAAPVAPVANPDLPANACGLNVALVMDSSGSIGNSGPNMYAAYKAILAGLDDTGSWASVVDFDDSATLVKGWTEITNPDDFDYAYSVGGWTNWQAALDTVPRGSRNPDLVVMLSDGNPNRPGSDFLNQAITAANTLKSSPIGAHMLGVAIGPSITVDNMKDITDGTASQLAPPANIVTDIRTLDVITSGFANLEDAMRKVASALCDGSVTVTKHVDGAAASGWEFSASPQPGSISPADATTGANGEVTFSWKLVDPTTKSVNISEILQSGFLFDSYSCSDGSSSDDSTDLTAELTVEQGKNISCTFENATVQPSIEIEKLTNGQDADTVPGPYIAVDDAVTWTYKVKNTGNVILTDVGVTDSQGVAVSCPKTTLEIDASMTCTASGIAVAGQYSNIGTATAKDPTGGTPSDEDTSHYYGVDAGIEIEKLTNGQDADTVPGPYIAVDDAVTWTYKVKNTGNVILTDVGVTDSQGVAVSCPKTTLEIDASMTCTASGIAVAGQYSNIGTATAKDPTGGTPSDEDTSHYYGVDAGIEIEKLTNGQDADTVPGPYIAVDDAVTWTYKVKNTGNVILTDVGVTDSQGVAVSCPKTTLEIDASMTCTASGIAVAGQYSNIGTATAKDPTGGTPSDEDTSHYYGVDAGIEIEKLTNGQDADTVPGPYIAVDDAVTWTYKVKNTGNVILTDVGVTDSQGVAVSCPKTTLEIDASMTCTASGIAVAGQYSNIGTATAKDPTGGTPSDEDTSHYYGVDAGIEIEKLTNGQDADTVPGPYIAVDDAVTWTYLVQATGNTSLANVVVTDSQGVVPVFSPASDANSNGLLDPGEIWVYKATGVAVAGQYSNIGTATAKDPAGGKPADNDPSHYYGVEGDLTLEKATNGQDADTPIGPYVPVGGAVTWTYVVTNGSNAAVSDIAVTDDVLGAITCSADMLAAGASMTCTATGAAEAGQYANIGEVAGIDAAEGTVGDTDPSHYYGVTAGIDIEKYSNGEQADIPTGPYVAADDPVTWTYLVQNTGNAPLAKVVVTDNQGVIPVFSNGDDNTNGLLDPGEIWVYEATGVAVAGQYSNIGTATAEDPTGGTAGDTDPSHYYGVEPGISLVKTGAFGIGDDVIANPGDVITYEFVVKNTGNVSLDTINVEDLDLGGINVSCPTTELAVGASMTCTADYPVTQEDINAGTVENCAVASGLDPLEADVSDKDCTETDIPQSPAIGITKSVAPTPINVGEATQVTWTIVVTNTGNVPLHAVTVSDALVPACDAAIGDLAIGGSTPQLTCRSIHTPDSLAWTFTNVAVAAGLGPLDTQVSATADARIDPIQTLGTAQLGDTVWQDLDKDGVQDSGEPGINGATVILKDSTGATIATATTAKGPWDGWYKFVGLDAGRYAVTLDLSSVSGQLTTAGSYTIDLAGGEEFLDADFGVAETLPKTGLEAEQLTLLAIALLAAGAFAVLASRRRKTDN